MKVRIEQVAVGSAMSVTSAMICECQRIELQSIEPVLGNAERGELDDGMGAALVAKSPEKTMDRQRVGYPSRGRPLGIGQTENEGADQTGPDAGRAKRGVTEMTYGGFPFRPRDADQRQLLVRFEQPRACARIRAIDIVYDCIGETRRKGGLFFVSGLQYDILRSPPDRVCRDIWRRDERTLKKMLSCAI